MKKWLIGVGIGVVAVGLVAAGAAFAALRAPEGNSALTADGRPNFPYLGGAGSDPFDGEAGLRAGGKLHDIMVSAVAESLNLTPKDLEAKLAAGQSLPEIAQEQGIAQDGLSTLLDQARSKALAKAVQDGILTQAQADWIEAHPLRLRMFHRGMMSEPWGYGMHFGPWGGFDGQR